MRKCVALVLQFLERYSDEESNPYLKPHFWKSIHYYPSVVEEYVLDKKENLITMKVIFMWISSLRADEDINDWEKSEKLLKGRPRILTMQDL